MHSCDVKPNHLLSLLMNAAGLNPHSLAKALNRPQMQGQIHRFVHGEVDTPQRRTVERWATYFKLDPEAFYSERAAARVAHERGLSGGDAAGVTPLVARDLVAPYAPARAPIDLQSAIAGLAIVCDSMDQASREALAPLLARLAREPQEAPRIGQLITALVESNRKPTVKQHA